MMTNNQWYQFIFLSPTQQKLKESLPLSIALFGYFFSHTEFTPSTTSVSQQHHQNKSHDVAIYSKKIQLISKSKQFVRTWSMEESIGSMVEAEHHICFLRLGPTCWDESPATRTKDRRQTCGLTYCHEPVACERRTDRIVKLRCIFDRMVCGFST